jgi:phage-related tail fiber protein
MSALDGLFGIREIRVGGVAVTFRQIVDLLGGWGVSESTDANGKKVLELTPPGAAGAAAADWKDSVRVATTAALPNSTRVNNVRTATANGALPSIDGQSLSVGEALLDKNHATGADRGVWVVTSLGGASAPWVLTRRADFDSNSEVTGGIRVPVVQGTSNGGKVFKLDTADPITINVTSLAFSADSGAGTTDHGTLTGLGDDDHPQYLLADGSRALTGNQSFGGFKGTNVGAPSAGGDAANKTYVDTAVAAALATAVDWKPSVRAATTANITLSGAQTIDGVSVIAGDRVLVKNQSTGSQNGIYVAAAGAWSRATDADASAEVTTGLATVVEEGTANGAKAFLLTTANPITLGTTALSFAQLSGSAHDNTSITLNGSSQLQRAALTGDVTASAGSNTTAFGSGNFAALTLRTTDRMIAAATGTPTALGDVGSQEACTTGSGTVRGQVCRQASADANGARFAGVKCRGTHASPSAHNADDVICSFVAVGHDGSAFYEAALQRFVASYAGGTNKATRLETYLHDGVAVRIIQETRVEQFTSTGDGDNTRFTIAIAADEQVSVHFRVRGIGPSNKHVWREHYVVYRRVGSGAPAKIAETFIIPLNNTDDTDWDINFAISSNDLLLRDNGETSATITWKWRVTIERD